MLCLFEQDFLKYYTKAGMDTEELEVGVRNSEGWFQMKFHSFSATQMDVLVTFFNPHNLPQR